MRVGASLRAWAELGRVSNLPTVVSNVAAGVALSGAGEVRLWGVAWACAGIALVYEGGMVLNDVMDAEEDARHRPERPIPSGRISRSAARRCGWALLAAGAAVTAPAGVFALLGALVIAALAVVYDRVHLRTPAAVVLPGVCRAMVPLVSAWAAGGTAAHAWKAGAAVGLCTLYLSVVARGEERERIGVWRWAGLILPAAPIALVRPVAGTLVWSAPAAGAMVVWLIVAASRMFGRQRSPRRAVLMYLAGLCAVDTYVVAVGMPGLLVVTVGCWALTVWGHRRIVGT